MNDYNPQKYNEYRVTLRYQKNKGGFEIDEKKQTARGTVSIHPHEAERNNDMVETTKLWYEAAEKDSSDDKEYRELLFKEADELGLKTSKNIGTKKLETKIQEAKK